MKKNKKPFHCPICGQKLQMIENTNILRCTNKSCVGVKKFSKGEVYYEPYIRILNEKGVQIYNKKYKRKSDNY